MYLIIGLGNPEKEYANTRHNMGFDVINKISKEYNIDISNKKFNGLYGLGEIKGEKIILLKPQTYMNLSGEAIIKFKNFYKILDENIIVIHDDVDLEVGDMRIRKKGGAGTHNGMKSVIEHLKTKEFYRIRIGIGMPEVKEKITEHVISKISTEDLKKLDLSITKASKAVVEIIENGIEKAMNIFN